MSDSSVRIIFEGFASGAVKASAETSAGIKKVGDSAKSAAIDIELIENRAKAAAKETEKLGRAGAEAGVILSAGAREASEQLEKVKREAERGTDSLHEEARAAGELAITLRLVGDESARAGRKAEEAGFFSMAADFGALGDASVAAAGKVVMFGAVWPAIGGLIMLAAGAVTAFVAALAPLVGLLVPAVALMGGFGLAIGTVILGLGGVVRALGGSKKAFKELTPAGQQFVTTLRSMAPELDKLKGAAQAGLFPGLLEGLRALDQPQIFKALTGAVGGMAKVLGDFAAGLGHLIGSNAGQFNTILQSFVTNAHQFSSVMLSGAHATMTLVTAAIPLTHWLGELSAHYADLIDKQISAAAASGGLLSFFEKTKLAVQQTIGLLSSMGGFLVHVLEAAYPSGVKLVSVLTDAFHAADKFVQSVQGHNELAAFFSASESAIASLLPLLGNVLRVAMNLGTQLAPLIHQLVPVANAVVNAIGQIAPSVAGLGSALIRALGPTIQQALPILGAEIIAFVHALTGIVNVVGEVLHAMGPLAPILTAVGAGFFLVIGPIGAVVGALTTVASTMLDVVVPAIAGMLAALGPVGLAIVAVGVAATGVAIALDALGGHTDSTTRSEIALENALNGVHSTMDSLKKSSDDLAQARITHAGAALAVRQGEANLAQSIKETGRTSLQSQQAANELAQERLNLKRTTDDLTQTETKHTTAERQHRAAIADAAAATEALRQKLNGQIAATEEATKITIPFGARVSLTADQLRHMSDEARSVNAAARDRAILTYASYYAQLERNLGATQKQAALVFNAVKTLAGELGRLPTTKEINIYLNTIRTGATPSPVQYRARGYASGGIIPLEPGTSLGKDSVPAILAPGEMVLNKDQQDRLGGQSRLAAMFGFGGVQHFATGGIAGRHIHPKATRRATLAKSPRGPGEAEINGMLNQIAGLEQQKAILDQQYNFMAAEFDLADRNLDYINTDPTTGIESVNTQATGTRSGQIGELTNRRHQVAAVLTQEQQDVRALIRLLQDLITEITKKIAELKKRIDEETKRIAADVKKIRDLQDEIAKERSKKGTRQYVIDPLTHKRVIRTVGGPDKGKIEALEHEKTVTERDKADTTAKRSKDKSALSAAQAKLVNFRTQKRTQGTADQVTLPGNVMEVELELDRLAAELVDISKIPAIVAADNKALLAQQGGDSGGGFGGGDFGGILPIDTGSSGQQQANSSQDALIGALKLALGIQNAQLPIIGAFAKGTIHVPETGMALVHAGEHIVPAAVAGAHRGAGGLQHHVLDLALGDKLDDMIEDKVVKVSDDLTVRMGRSANRRAREGRY